ncbi:MAG TPA: phytanoyl-CoA dioxygenase family protein, partial [Stellaceae bacterium]|nr:phytanoyl-CoA dioxygenase family protein [Stellaceae bacterium]
MMLSTATLASYRRDGFVVLPDILTAAEVDALRRVTDDFVQAARSVGANDEIYDLEDSHSSAEPRVRRIKTPHLHHPEYARAARHPKIIEVLRDLWGTVRFDTGKLNMKSAGYGAPVEWHQDWAFYPHTNDDLAAIGIMLDDCDLENGPMMIVPGSHLGPVYDHHG